jgi:hypothetical protein
MKQEVNHSTAMSGVSVMKPHLQNRSPNHEFFRHVFGTHPVQISIRLPVILMFSVLLSVSRQAV